MARQISVGAAAGASTTKKPDTALDVLWLKGQFEQLNTKLNAILAELRGSGAGKLTPELEKQVNRASALSHTLDRKVPDDDQPGLFPQTQPTQPN